LASVIFSRPSARVTVVSMRSSKSEGVSRTNRRFAVPFGSIDTVVSASADDAQPSTAVVASAAVMMPARYRAGGSDPCLPRCSRG
jgi:hypothetical protein